MAAVALAVILLFFFTLDTVLLPLINFLGVLWKALLKLVATPELLGTWAKNAVVMQTKKVAFGAGLELGVMSHSLARRRLGKAKRRAIAIWARTVASYRSAPMTVQLAIAVGVAAITASAGYTFMIVLILPRFITDWLKAQLLILIQKTGVGAFCNKLYAATLPRGLASRIDLVRKWRIGRYRVRYDRASRRIVEEQKRKRRRGKQ